MERAVYEASRAGFRAVGAANRTLHRGAAPRVRPSGPARRAERDLFDLDPDRRAEDDRRRHPRSSPPSSCARPRPRPTPRARRRRTLLKRSVTELGVTLVGVPETLGGMGTERSATTGVLVAEALAHGDMGLAVACLAPAARQQRAGAVGRRASSRPTYLPAFVGDDVPAAALARARAAAAVRPVRPADHGAPAPATASCSTA